jgi:hypothetical protein
VSTWARGLQAVHVIQAGCCTSQTNRDRPACSGRDEPTESFSCMYAPGPGREHRSWPHHQIRKLYETNRFGEGVWLRLVRVGPNGKAEASEFRPIELCLWWLCGRRCFRRAAAAAVRPGAPGCCSLPETDSPPRFASRPFLWRRDGTNLRNIDGAGSADRVSFPRMQSRSHSFLLNAASIYRRCNIYRKA